MVAALLCLALVPALLQSPFLHQHNGPESRHIREEHDTVALVLHAHGLPTAARPGTSGTLVSSTEEETDATALGWFHARQMSAPALAVEPAEFASVKLPEPQSRQVRPLVPRAHDPPDLRRPSARAPPV